MKHSSLGFKCGAVGDQPIPDPEAWTPEQDIELARYIPMLKLFLGTALAVPAAVAVWWGVMLGYSEGVSTPPQDAWWHGLDDLWRGCRVTLFFRPPRNVIEPRTHFRRMRMTHAVADWFIGGGLGDRPGRSGVLLPRRGLGTLDLHAISAHLHRDHSLLHCCFLVSGA